MNISGFQKILKKEKMDLALIVNLGYDRFNANLFYFSGYDGLGILAVPQTGKAFMIVPELEEKKAKETKIQICVNPKSKRLFEILKNELKNKKIRCETIGIDKSVFTLLLYKEFKKHFKNVKIKDIYGVCENLRKIKAKEEIKTIKRAFSISNEIFNGCLRKFKRFKTEEDVKNYLEIEAKKRGCGLAFSTIAASGANSAKVHHNTSEQRLKKGFCVIDFGIRYKGYCTDMTRTIYLGKISKKEKKMYNFLLNVQKSIIKKIKINMKCSDIYNECKTELGRYEQYFTHGLGHGIGLKIHELPNITSFGNDKIQKGMLFTIEPGLYFDKYGIRIEDTMLMGDKPEILTKVSKDLEVVR